MFVAHGRQRSSLNRKYPRHLIELIFGLSSKQTIFGMVDLPRLILAEQLGR
jgi:hypothetical protein